MRRAVTVLDYHSAGAAVRTNWLLGDVFILLSERESKNALETVNSEGQEFNACSNT